MFSYLIERERFNDDAKAPFDSKDFDNDAFCLTNTTRKGQHAGRENQKVAQTRKGRYLGSSPCVANDIYGGQGRGRTADTRIFSPLLYQLSYLAAPRAISDKSTNFLV